MSHLAKLAAALILAISIVRGGVAHSPGVADADQAIAHEVEAFREFTKRAIARKDGRALRALYADNSIHVDGSGRVQGKEERIAALLSGEPAIESAPAEELNYRVFGGHTIVVTGRSRIARREDRNGDVRWLIVYVKAQGDWQIGASQITPAR